MLTSKVFFKETKRGTILKICREHYLRDDIWCGSYACTKCKEKDSQKVLDENPGSKSKLVPEPHYIFLDTNAILDQIDALEEPFLCNIVITQTVLDEVKHRSSVVFKRLRSIIGDPRRKMLVFVNEHNRETFVKSQNGESKNDRNDRAIRVAANWFQNHLKIQSVLLTDDTDNIKKSRDEGLKAFSLCEYAEATESLDVIEKLSSKRWSKCKDEDSIDFPPHLKQSDIQMGIKNGKLVQGTFLASRENCLEATVTTDSSTILIQGKNYLNRAIDGDTVAVEVLPKEEWKAPSNMVVEEAEDLNEPASEDSEEEKQVTGKVVGIIHRKWKQYCGILQLSSVPGHTRHLVIPAKRQIPKIRIETRQGEKLSNQRIVVVIDSWPCTSRYPQGHFVRALGKIGDKETENEVLLLEHDVPSAQFTDTVLSCLPKMPWVITEDELKRRRDIRHIDVCSVDPPGCTDIDDALHCFKLPNGNYEAGVHIADVSHFIRPGTALDKEASLRSTTVYLVDKRIDMVPDLLSSNLCSLRGGEERLAFSCTWELTPNAEIVKRDFFKSVIRSRAALTYQQAQIKIDDPSDDSSLAQTLRNLNTLAKILKKRRIDNGALVLASPEIRFHVDSETHDPIDVEAKKLLETNSMVEEFMLLANVTVAEKILDDFPDCAMLRRHPAPPATNFDPIIKAAEHQGFKINTESGKDLAVSLDKAVKADNDYFNVMLRILTTRCMMQAVYFSSGMHQKDEYFHYGLAAPVYTHFTSPIRRYADIIVHRLLAVCVGADSTYPDLLDKKKSHELCHNLNYRHRMAQYAGRASVALHTHLFFRGKINDEEGYILFVKKNALQILIPKFGLEGTVFLDGKKSGGKVNHPPFTFQVEDHTQRCGDIVFHAFDRVIVQLSLDSTNVQREKLQMKLVQPFIEGLSIPPISAA